MTTSTDTTIPQQNLFPFTSTRAMATAQMAETDQATVRGLPGGLRMEFLVQPEPLGPVFIRDTQGSVAVRYP